MQVREQRESRNGREQSREQQSATRDEEKREEDEEAKAKRRRRREEGGRAGNGNFTEGQAKRTVGNLLKKTKKKKSKIVL
jgi:hypothetical protein